MAAVVAAMDRTAYRRLDRRLWAAEDRAHEWGRYMRARSRAPCDWPEVTPIYRAMRTADPWLEAARRDPSDEPEWVAEFNTLVGKHMPVIRTFLRRRYVDGLTTDQARAGLNMSENRAREILRAFRESVWRAFFA